ncbi:MAG TPA: hypothetical protein VGO77_00010 [Mycobacterium sp.]|nr:hypothetical protein [Mycobacterium sp.]
MFLIKAIPASGEGWPLLSSSGQVMMVPEGVVNGHRFTCVALSRWLASELVNGIAERS